MSDSAETWSSRTPEERESDLFRAFLDSSPAERYPDIDGDFNEPAPTSLKEIARKLRTNLVSHLETSLEQGYSETIPMDVAMLWRLLDHIEPSHAASPGLQR